jgi:hypothetical protein
MAFWLSQQRTMGHYGEISSIASKTKWLHNHNSKVPIFDFTTRSSCGGLFFQIPWNWNHFKHKQINTCKNVIVKVMFEISVRQTEETIFLPFYKVKI